MYEKNDIEEMLRSYLISKSQLDELENKISKNEVLIKYNGKKYKQSEEETIKAMALNSVVISDIPKRQDK